MSLAKLVVHLQANYSGLTSGLQVAQNQTATAAQQISRSVSNIGENAAGLDTLRTRAEQVSMAFESVATAADVVDASASAAAFAAERTAGGLRFAAQSSAVLSSGLTVLDKSAMVTVRGMSAMTGALAVVMSPLLLLSQSFAGLVTLLRVVASAAQRVSIVFRAVGQWIGTVTGTLLHFLHVAHAAKLVLSLLSAALSVLLIPIRIVAAGIAHLAAIALMALRGGLYLVLMPLRLLWSGLVLATKAVMAILRPIISLALAVFKVWFVFKGWVGVIRIIGQWLALLPPKVRLLVGALLALGLAGKAGVLALRAFSFVVSAVSLVVRGAVTAIKLLALPILAIVNPAAAARLAMSLLADAVIFAGRAALRAGLAFLSFTGKLANLAKQGIASAVSSLTSLAGSMLKVGAQAAVYGAVAASFWGVKLATAAETSRVVFGTMLHDMAQGKALLDQMQGSSVAPFFDAKAIQDAGRDLLKAKVPVDQITSRMEQLGGIALATKTPIEDLSRIYRQGMAKGAFQTDLVNQMASRGIDIYAALTAVTGASGEALAEMMSSGKIGAAEMNAAIDHMTLGHGIYAGVVDNVAKTTAGMWSTSVNNISMALQTMFGVAVEGNNGLLASIVSVTDQVKQRAASIGPVILQLSQMIIGIFRGLQAIVGTVWATVFGQTQTTFAGMLGTTMEWVTKFRWFFENIVPVVQFVGLMMLLTLVSVFNDIAYWFTTKLPAYLDWFANNWKAVFRDLAVGTMAVFTNLGSNIKNAMGVIWAFIKSGGTSGLEFAWTPLLDGFKSTVAELPDIPDRAMTALEAGLQEQMQTIGTNLADSFDAMMADANASMAAAAAGQPPVPLQSTPAGGSDVSDSDGASDLKNQQQDNSPLLKGSREAQAAIYAAIAQGQSQKDKAAEKVAAIAKKQLEEAQKLNLRLATAGTIAVVETLD